MTERKDDIIIKNILQKENIYLVGSDKSLSQLRLYQMDGKGFKDLGQQFHVSLSEYVMTVEKQFKDKQIIYYMVLDIIAQLIEYCHKNNINLSRIHQKLVSLNPETNLVSYPLQIVSRIQQQQNAFLYIISQVNQSLQEQQYSKFLEYITQQIINNDNENLLLLSLNIKSEMLKQNISREILEFERENIKVSLINIKQMKINKFKEGDYYQLSVNPSIEWPINSYDTKLMRILQLTYLYKDCLNNIQTARIIFNAYDRIIRSALKKERDQFEDPNYVFDHKIFNKKYSESNENESRSPSKGHFDSQYPIQFNYRNHSNQMVNGEQNYEEQILQIEQQLSNIHFTQNSISQNQQTSPNKHNQLFPFTKDISLNAINVVSVIQNAQTLVQDYINILKSSQVIIAGFQICNVKQKTNEWIEERKKRITASNFGKICRSRQQTRPSLVKQFVDSKYFSNEAIKYGNTYESVARDKYLEHLKTISNNNNIQIKEYGLIVDGKYNWIAGSPDGLVYENDVLIGCIEIKCPFSIKDSKISQDFHLTQFLEKDGNSVILKRNNVYYYQVQGIMYLTGQQWCDFIVYTQIDLHVERIPFDNNFVKNMLFDLNSFFFDYFILHYLLPDGTQEERDSISNNNEYQAIVKKYYT